VNSELYCHLGTLEETTDCLNIVIKDLIQNAALEGMEETRNEYPKHLDRHPQGMRPLLIHV
jgi:hypothetical protein